DEVELDGVAEFFGNVLQVLLVLVAKNDGVDARAFGCENFLLDAAYGEDGATESDLARHGELVADRATCEERGQRGEDGDTRAGSVFGNSACGNVDVVVVIGEGRVRNAQGRRNA